METTRLVIPSPASRVCASSARETSEPVAIRITSGVESAASTRTYAPCARPAAPANTVRSSTGNFCRDSTAPAALYAFGFYMDEGSRFITVTNNVLIRTRSGLHTNAPKTSTSGDLRDDTNYISANVATLHILHGPEFKSFLEKQEGLYKDMLGKLGAK